MYSYYVMRNMVNAGDEPSLEGEPLNLKLYLSWISYKLWELKHQILTSLKRKQNQAVQMLLR